MGRLQGTGAPGFEVVDVMPTLVREAVGYLDAHAQPGGPSFLYLPLTSPHTPLVPPPDWKDKSGINPYADFVMEREVLAAVDLRQNRFGFEPEITAKVAALGVRVYEVPVSYHGRTYQEGKKIGWRDAVQALLCIACYGVFASGRRGKLALQTPPALDRSVSRAAGNAAFTEPDLTSTTYPPHTRAY